MGVAIATALVPPLATCGLLVARGDWTLAGGALLLFVTNLVAIQVASALVLYLLGYHAATARWEDFTWSNGISLGILVVLVVILSLNLSQEVNQAIFESEVQAKLTAAVPVYPGAYLDSTRLLYSAATTEVIAVVRTPRAFTPVQVGDLWSEPL